MEFACDVYFGGGGVYKGQKAEKGLKGRARFGVGTLERWELRES